jgi:hypothetical protein
VSKSYFQIKEKAKIRLSNKKHWVDIHNKPNEESKWMKIKNFWKIKK